MNPIVQINSYDLDQQTILFVNSDEQMHLSESYEVDLTFLNAEEGDVQLLNKNGKKVFAVGLGKKSDYGSYKKLAKKFSHSHKDKLENANTTIILPSQLSEGQIKHLILGLFDGTYKIRTDQDAPFHPLWNKKHTLSLYQPNTKIDLSEIGKEAQILAEGKFIGMDLLNLPPNKKTSNILAEFAQKFAKDLNLKVDIFDKKKCQELGLTSFLSVNQASAYEPAFIILEYKPEHATKMVGVVGKCVTFDTGGISIKGSQNMHYMKSDMGGATTVLGMMLAASKLKLDQHIIAILPATDNAVNKDAYLPGDVIDSYAGKTIEVINTDAEGRMTLADGLAYMNDVYKPDVLIDIATLTGSAVRTLGYKGAAMLTVSDDISNKLSSIGNEINEKVWRLPLWDEYLEDLQSDVADLKHISLSPLSDVIYAGKFLQQFTNDHPEWVHLDIAGVAFGNNDYSKDKSATGYGVELLIEFIKTIL